MNRLACVAVALLLGASAAHAAETIHQLTDQARIEAQKLEGDAWLVQIEVASFSLATDDSGWPDMSKVGPPTALLFYYFFPPAAGKQIRVFVRAGLSAAQRLKKQVGPRQLDRDAFLKALAGQPKAPVEILYLRDDADSLKFAQEIENQLRRAGWTVTARESIPVVPGSDPGIPITMSVGGQPSGVTVVVRSITEEEADAGRKRIIGRDDWVKTPWTVLVDAFGRSMGVAQSAGNVASCPEGVLRVIVGPRW